jgi:hypothetical protein
MSTYRTIILKGDGLPGESVANSAITPGMLLNFRSDGKVEPAAALTNNAEVAVALENQHFGQGIDTDYAVGDNVEYRIFQAGAEFNGLVNAAAPAIALNDLLTWDANGCVKKFTGAAGSATVAMRAKEALDNSAGATKARLIVEVIR